MSAARQMTAKIEARQGLNMEPELSFSIALVCLPLRDRRRPFFICMTDRCNARGSRCRRLIILCCRPPPSPYLAWRLVSLVPPQVYPPAVLPLAIAEDVLNSSQLSRRSADQSLQWSPPTSSLRRIPRKVLGLMFPLRPPRPYSLAEARALPAELAELSRSHPHRSAKGAAQFKQLRCEEA